MYKMHPIVAWYKLFWFKGNIQFSSADSIMTFSYIGVGSGAAGAALAAPLFCLVAVLGPRFFSRYASCLFYNPVIEYLRARFARECF